MILALMLSQATGVVEGGNQTSAIDKTVFSIDAIDEMRDTLEDLRALRDATPDTLRSTCLDTKAQRIQDLVDQAEQASVATVDAIAAGEEARAEHEFRKVGVALMRTRQLSEEAQLQCAVSVQQEEAAVQLGWSGVQPD